MLSGVYCDHIWIVPFTKYHFTKIIDECYHSVNVITLSAFHCTSKVQCVTQPESVNSAFA